MSATIRDSDVVVGFDFSTGSVKGLAYDGLANLIAEVRLPTDLWTAGGVSELNLMMLEGQVRAAVRATAAELRDRNRLNDWVAVGISATHHSAGRIDAHGNQVRRAICWNDQTLAEYHAQGLSRIGGQSKAIELTGGPWAVRYSLSHLMKDEQTLSRTDWERTRWTIGHGGLVAGYMTDRFDAVSASVAASTGIMDLRTDQWCPAMLDALETPDYRRMAVEQLPRIIPWNQPIGPISAHLCEHVGIRADRRPVVYPTSDDQQAGLVGGGATEAGQVAVILGNSAVVNSSAATLPKSGTLDAMKLSWGPYLWMRCFSNGAQFLDRVVGPKPDWGHLETTARAVPPGCGGFGVSPFVLSEPSIGVTRPRFEWYPSEPTEVGVRYRASLEAIAYLIALGLHEHERAGQVVTRVSVSGGIAQSPLMGEILASVLGRPLERLESSEGPALGAAVVAIAAHAGVGVADAVQRLVRFRDPVRPVGEWEGVYRVGLREFQKRLG